MAFYLSPLVDVNEIDLSTTIPAVATSIGVIALRDTYKGQEGKQIFITDESDLIREFGEPTDSSYEDLLSASGFLKYGNKLYCTRVARSDATFSGITIDNAGVGDAFTGTDTGFPTQTLIDLPSGDPYDFGEDISVTTAGDLIWAIASSRGAWGDNIRVGFLDASTQAELLDGTVSPVVGGGTYETFSEIDSNITDPGDPTAESKNFLVVVSVKDQRKSTYVVKEVFNVSTDPNALDDTQSSRYAETVINDQSAYIKIALGTALVDAAFDSDLVHATGDSSTEKGWYSFTGGGNGVAAQSDADIISAYRLYDNAEEIDVNLIIDSGKSDTVKSDLISMCEERLDCMTILDVPKVSVVNNTGSETTDLRTWRTSTFNENTSYASVYGNWIEVYDKYNQKYRWIPASGHVAGIYAKTDDVADPWWAPAGLNRAILTGVRRLAWNPKQGNRDILYSNGINPIVSFAGEGKVIWGQKTLLSKESAFNRVNVRRLFMILEKAISTASKYFLFEPNDSVTRSLLVNMITPFLRDVKARRGIYDFRVIADETINTPERVDRNELWVNILIKPTRTAEFIVLNFVATKTGASFEEAASAVA